VLSRIYSDRYKIGVPQWRVLVTLGLFGAMTAKAVGNHSHMHKTKVSRGVAPLEGRKLVIRRTNRDDLREGISIADSCWTRDLQRVGSDCARFCGSVAGVG